MVEDPDGNRFLDFAAGIAVVATGHCHPQVVKAIQEQAARLIHMSGTDFYYENMVELAEKLAALRSGGRSTASLFRQLRDRSDRGRPQAGTLPHRPRAVRRVCGSFPRPNHGFAGADRQQEHPEEGLLSDDARRASRAVRLLLSLRVREDARYLRGGMRRGDRNRAVPHYPPAGRSGGDLRRTGPGRGRLRRSAPKVFRRAASTGRQARHPSGRRRSAERHGPDRQDVRLRAFRLRARHHRAGQGNRQRDASGGDAWPGRS